MQKAFKQSDWRLQVQRWEPEEGHLDVLNYSLKFAFFWCLLIPLGPSTPLPIKIRSRKLANCIWLMGDRVQSHQQSPLLGAHLWSLDSGFFPRKESPDLSCCLKSKTGPFQQEHGPGREAINKIMGQTHSTYSISLYK